MRDFCERFCNLAILAQGSFLAAMAADEHRLPADLSGFFCAIPLQLSNEVDGTFLVIAEKLRIWFLLITTYIVQLLFLFHIADITEKKKATTSSSEYRLLNHVCVFVFMVQIFQEVHL